MGGEDFFIGSYRLISKIGSGTFGQVYLVQHVILTNRLVAIKLMHANHLEDTEEIMRFLIEPQYLEKLKHPYILPVVDVGVYDGFPYQIIDYAAKGSLRERLRRQVSSPLPIAEAITILTQIGQALQYAHEQDVIHRDLKPENILFNERGDALLADFGIATTLSEESIKHTSSAGTIAYMAPEQFQDMVCKESDQYALGCIAYELFTGRMPFRASNLATFVTKCLTEQPVAPSHYNPRLPEHMELAILKAMAKQRKDRHADVSTFIAALVATPSKLSQEAKKEWMNEFIALGMFPGQKEKVIEACERAIKIDSTFAEAYYCKGVMKNL
jgi:serine/threonine protein kinase